MGWRDGAWLLAAAVLASGCAEHLSVFEKGSIIQPLSKPEFWPPPAATLLWSSPPVQGGTWGEAARTVARTLRDAGYADERWYPIGVEYAHGFAVTTRLERAGEDGAPMPTPERWSPLYGEAATLLWLERAATMRLPAAGRYRVFFVAFTDLPFEHVPQRAPLWNEQTVMAAPGMRAVAFPGARDVGDRYRVGVYVYEDASESRDGEGAFVGSDALAPAVVVERSGLATVASVARAD